MCMMPLPYVGSKMFTAFQGRVPFKFYNLTDKNPFKPMVKTMVQACLIWTLNDKIGCKNIFCIIWGSSKSKYIDGERLLSTFRHENSWFCRLLSSQMISVSTFVLKTSYMLSNASWEAPTQNRIIPNESMIHLQFIHLVKFVSAMGPAPRGFGDLGRMTIYFQGAGEHW